MHRWILVVDQDSLRDLEPLVVNLTHVTAVASRVPLDTVRIGVWCVSWIEITGPDL